MTALLLGSNMYVCVCVCARSKNCVNANIICAYVYCVPELKENREKKIECRAEDKLNGQRISFGYSVFMDA